MQIIQKNLQILVDEFSRGSINKFANDYLDDRSQNLTNWIKGDRNPNFEKLSKLFETIPNLSLEWLFRGKGSMIVSNENDVLLELEKWKIRASKIEQDNEMLKEVIRREHGNFQEGDPSRLLADDILMMITYPASFNVGAFTEIN
jgi:hypothetical protein